MASPADLGTVSAMSNAPHLQVESQCWSRGELLVCGMDEVGRGALAGPVTLGAVVVPQGELPESSPLHAVRDSKMLSPARREALLVPIQEWALAWGVGSASPAEVDSLGMTAALRLAGERALAQVALSGVEPDRVLLDGPHNYLGQGRVTTLVKGDASSLAIAAASIVAKVTRDREMRDLAARYPQYGFDRNTGYGSALHRSALVEHGVTDVHRRSWALLPPETGEQLSLLD